MNAKLFIKKDYENQTAFRQGKNKPNQTQLLAPFFRMSYTLRGPAHRKPRSLIIKKLTTSRMVANLRFEELNSGFVVSKFGV
jgi:hypothetical protein